MTARIQDVAAQAGVSTATVSRVLSGVDNVSAALTERVWKAVTDLDYRPNRVARRLRRPGREMWALIVPDVENRFFTSVARGVEEVANEYDITVFIGNTDYDPDRLRRYLSTALAEQVAGIILAPSSPTDDVSDVLASQIPIVTVDQSLTSRALTTVMTDHHEGGRLAGEHLAKRGYERIGVIAGPQHSPEWNTRLEGLQASIAPESIVAIERGDNRVGGGAAAMGRLLDDHPGLEAVFVTNNLMTVGALREIDLRTLRVPEDVYVVGYDLNSQEWTRAVPVSTVNQDPRRIGEVAARTLIDSGGVPQERRTILLEPHLEESIAL